MQYTLFLNIFNPHLLFPLIWIKFPPFFFKSVQKQGSQIMMDDLFIAYEKEYIASNLKGYV